MAKRPEIKFIRPKKDHALEKDLEFVLQLWKKYSSNKVPFEMKAFKYIAYYLFLIIQQNYRTFEGNFWENFRRALCDSRGTFPKKSYFIKFYNNSWTGAEKKLQTFATFFLGTVAELAFYVSRITYLGRRCNWKEILIHNGFQNSSQTTSPGNS